jgi:hypothetical protein
LLRRWGFEAPESAATLAQWQGISLGLNAAVVKTPLLIQVADAEMLAETQTFTALRLAQKPVEMHVFPGEFHVKSQPAHRMAIYRRNVQWFQFWLRGIEEPDPADALQYARWRAL